MTRGWGGWRRQTKIDEAGVRFLLTPPTKSHWTENFVHPFSTNHGTLFASFAFKYLFRSRSTLIQSISRCIHQHSTFYSFLLLSLSLCYTYHCYPRTTLFSHCLNSYELKTTPSLALLLSPKKTRSLKKTLSRSSSCQGRSEQKNRLVGFDKNHKGRSNIRSHTLTYHTHACAAAAPKIGVLVLEQIQRTTKVSFTCAP